MKGKRGASRSQLPDPSRLRGMMNAARAAAAVGILLISLVAMRFVFCSLRPALHAKTAQGMLSQGTSRGLADEELSLPTTSVGHGSAAVAACLSGVGSSDGDQDGGFSPLSHAIVSGIKGAPEAADGHRTRVPSSPGAGPLSGTWPRSTEALVTVLIYICVLGAAFFYSSPQSYGKLAMAASGVLATFFLTELL